jgi:cytochrome c-type biogenesis protein CcmH/NrfG
MTLRSMSAAGSLVLASALLTLAAWSQETASPAGKPSAATLQHDIERCKARANLDDCYDAIRWNPSDTELLEALGDALVRANRTADAIRTYRRAAALAPGSRGLTAKITTAEAKLSATRAPGATSSRSAGDPASAKRYSNAAPEAQSH